MQRIQNKIAWGLVGALSLLVVASLAGVVRGGPLDPTAPPAPTMKTLDDLPPVWDQQLSSLGGCSSARWKCVMGGAAALDRETGLVWQAAPSSSLMNWINAVASCYNQTTGSRFGWRLPRYEELRSLFNTSGSDLPSGHPFTFTAGDYWSITTQHDTPASAMVVDTATPLINFGFAKTGSAMRWCVRGGHGYDSIG